MNKGQTGSIEAIKMINGKTLTKQDIFVMVDGEIIERFIASIFCSSSPPHLEGVILNDGRKVLRESDMWIYKPK